MSDEPGPEYIAIFCRCLVISCTDRATDENGMSTIMSTFSASYQRVAMEEPISALFW